MLINNGFSLVKVDKCVYLKYENYECVVISLYVDDILIFRFTFQIVTKTKIFLALKSEMKDISEVSIILGIKITRRDNSTMLSQ